MLCNPYAIALRNQRRGWRSLPAALACWLALAGAGWRWLCLTITGGAGRRFTDHLKTGFDCWPDIAAISRFNVAPAR
jgi:hypothetical protein